MIVLDEPLASLDASAQAQLANLLVDLSRELGLGLLLISHDLAIVRHVADAVSVMYLGLMVETGPTLPLWQLPLHPYSEALIGAVPHPDGSGFLPEALPGEVPDPGAAAERLPLPSALPVRVRPLQRRGAAARRARGRPRGGLLAPAGGRDGRSACRSRRQLVTAVRSSNRVEGSTISPADRRHTVKRLRVRRAVWLLAARGSARAACARSPRTARTTRSSAAPTLVVDNSFTIKTSDPQRAFDPTASIVDRAIYDTLFTYKRGDLATRSRCSCSRGRRANGREDVHVPAQAERPLRRRDAAHLGRRRLLAEPADQPEGQPGVPARRHHGLGAPGSTRS